MEVRKAERRKSKIRLGLAGPSGSGKTMSALLIACGLAKGDWSKVVVIDTEEGSADLYEHLGEYNVLPLSAPFSPERYIEAIKACENAGMEVIIIDSSSHEWSGVGGCLEINESLARAKYKGNSWSAWNETTPRHDKFVNAILQSKCHVIACARSKTETVMGDDKKVKKVGMKEIQREGWEYELTLSFNIDRETHTAIVSKDRTELFEGVDPFIVTKETGDKILKWCESGKEPVLSIEDRLKSCKTTVELGIAFKALSVDDQRKYAALTTELKSKLPEKLEEAAA
ncbi:AAA family ATPase [Olivibacter sp. LS-1]|uniref:ATP-binding protein n=1 Tax=Olivibacter sp. LS-1 TaxID=2592345 RepID=UPI0011EB45CB|nr:ATP-binding protein [Olivibacter sp. LS-1]QEL01094.1 AAA family ATPase [Olivibacter sp. LS-1]